MPQRDSAIDQSIEDEDLVQRRQAILLKWQNYPEAMEAFKLYVLAELSQPGSPKDGIEFETLWDPFRLLLFGLLRENLIEQTDAGSETMRVTAAGREFYAQLTADHFGTEQSKFAQPEHFEDGSYRLVKSGVIEED